MFLHDHDCNRMLRGEEREFWKSLFGWMTGALRQEVGVEVPVTAREVLPGLLSSHLILHRHRHELTRESQSEKQAMAYLMGRTDSDG